MYPKQPPGVLFHCSGWTPKTPTPSNWLDSWNKVCPVTLSMAFNFLRDSHNSTRRVHKKNVQRSDLGQKIFGVNTFFVVGYCCAQFVHCFDVCCLWFTRTPFYFKNSGVNEWKNQLHSCLTRNPYFLGFPILFVSPGINIIMKKKGLMKPIISGPQQKVMFKT